MGICDGHNGGSCYWFSAVMLPETEIIKDSDVVKNEEFSIEETDVYHFLYYFLIKHFDEKLSYNQRRENYGYCGGDFDPNLTHNLYTYEIINNMINEINETTKLLEKDFNNKKLDNIKKNFNKPDEELYNNKTEIIQSYNRFVKRIEEMMKNNPDTNIISVVGP